MLSLRKGHSNPRGVMAHRLRTAALAPLIDRSLSVLCRARCFYKVHGWGSTNSHRNKWGKVIDRVLQ